MVLLCSYCMKVRCSFGSTCLPCNVTERMGLNSAALLCKNREINQWTGNSCTNSSPGTAITKPFQTLPQSWAPKQSHIQRIKLKSSIFTNIRSIIWSLTESDMFLYIHRLCTHSSFPAQSQSKFSVYLSEKQKEISFYFSSSSQTKQQFNQPQKTG